MLTPTTPLITDYPALEKTKDDYLQLIGKAQEIFEIAPQNPDETKHWRVRFPDMLGNSWWYDAYFGRNRWYEFFPTAPDPYIRNRRLATAPEYVFTWERWHQPEDFIHLLNSEFLPVQLATKLGSNLAALQLLVDMWDHLQTRDKLSIQLQSPLRTVSLSSATSLLNWPSLFAQEMNHLSFRQSPKGFVASRISHEVARNITLTKNWLLALTTFSPSLETACQIRTLILQHLKAHQEQKIALIPRWEREKPSGPAKIVDLLGTTETIPSAPVLKTMITKSDGMHLKIYVTRPAPKNDKRETLCDEEGVVGGVYHIKKRRISSVTVI